MNTFLNPRSNIAFFLAFCAAQVVAVTALADDGRGNGNDHNRHQRTDCVIDSSAGQTGGPGSIDTQKIGRIFTSHHKAPQMSPAEGAWVFFGVTPNTSVLACDYFGLQFRFDSGTPDGKALLTTLLYAKAAGKFVDINYCSPTQLGLQPSGPCSNLTQVTIAGAISVRD